MTSDDATPDTQGSSPAASSASTSASTPAASSTVRLQVTHPLGVENLVTYQDDEEYNVTSEGTDVPSGVADAIIASAAASGVGIQKSEA